jgi:hypothetical protein
MGWSRGHPYFMGRDRLDSNGNLRCAKCGGHKSLDEFHIDKHDKYGRLSYCKQCQYVLAAEHRAMNNPNYKPRNHTDLSEESHLVCSKCNKSLPRDSFCKNTRRKSRGGASDICRACDKLREQGLCTECGVNPKVFKSSLCKGCGTNYRRLRAYGILKLDYDNILANQNGVCAICGTDHPGGRGNTFHVDHDHDTGKVRALLCSKCNNGIGQFNDNPELLEAAAAYLRAHRG